VKILLLDIETAPHKAYVWGLWDQNITLDRLEEPGFTLCFSARWLGTKKILFHSVEQDGHKNMIIAAHKLLDEADAVVHFNGTKFDIPILRGEFLLRNMRPPSPFKQIDLYRVFRRQFRFPSNKLDYALRILDIGEKVRHRGMDLWKGCMKKDPKCWREMKRYNIGDIKGLEPLYKRLLPWINNHPNHGTFAGHDHPTCTNCGSTHLQARGDARTKVGVYRRYQCMGCGTWVRGACSVLPRGSQQKVLRQIVD
jgi:RNase_H superfamily